MCSQCPYPYNGRFQLIRILGPLLEFGICPDAHNLVGIWFVVISGIMGREGMWIHNYPDWGFAILGPIANQDVTNIGFEFKQELDCVRRRGGNLHQRIKSRLSHFACT